MYYDFLWKNLRTHFFFLTLNIFETSLMLGLRKLKLTKSRNFNISTWKAFKNLIQKANEIPSFPVKNETKTDIFLA